jgi:PAS domain-containing protein
MAQLLDMGFAGVEATTRAALPVWSLYWRMARSQDRAVVTSGCPAVVALVEQYHPDTLALLAPVASFAEAHARLIKARCRARGIENARVVNIAPEAAVLGERRHSGQPSSLDGAMTLREARWWMRVHADERRPAPNGRLAMDQPSPPLEWSRSIFPIYGIRECREFLRRMPRHLSPGTIVEMTACRYGCALGSPWVLARVSEASSFLYPEGSPLAPQPREDFGDLDLSRAYRDRHTDYPQPTREELDDILRRSGKRRPAEHINCGACGYDSCREHAVAIFRGMAEVEMCTPYMRRRAQEASCVIENTANGVLLVDQNLEIQFANPAFRRMFSPDQPNVIGFPARQIFQNDYFERALTADGRLAEIGRRGDLVFRLQVFPIRGEPLLGAVIVDISAEARAGEEFKRVREATLQRAQEVITRQMKTAQEIAGLLGETTAETKALLVQLMNLARRETLT